jgi:hypothetical protein
MLWVIRINLQHSRAASSALCRILVSGRIDVADSRALVSKGVSCGPRGSQRQVNL